MFIIIGLLITVAIFIAASRLRVPRGGANAAHLGSMSEQWLAEQRTARRT